MTSKFPEKVAQRVLMVLQQDFIPITQFRSDLPPPLVACVHRGLSRKPADRFASARQFRKALITAIA